MDDNQRSHVIEEVAKALGRVSKARDYLDDETGWIGQALNSSYADLAEVLDHLRREAAIDIK
jgi:hypothetical protein